MSEDSEIVKFRTAVDSLARLVNDWDLELPGCESLRDVVLGLKAAVGKAARVETCSALLGCWNKVPSLRLGQLLVNFMSSEGWMHSDHKNEADEVACNFISGKLYYIPDQNLLEKIDGWIKEISVAKEGKSQE